MKTTKAFTVNKAIIRSLISSQAGSLTKAIEELVSNSLDAKSKRIDINIDEHGFVITDDGLGFVSEQEIESCFGDFGFDHSVEAEQKRGRKLGRFGLGRGQIFNFCRSVWTTNQFRMSVDLHDDSEDAAYTFETLNEVAHQGCKIEGVFYSPISLMDLHSISAMLKSHLKYVEDMDVYFNGKLMNTKRSTVKWTHEDDAFLFRTSCSTQGVDLYNMGVFVETIPHSRYGVSGELVSKQTLELNMARNSWLEVKCPLYREGKKLLESYGGSLVKRSKSLTIADRQYLINQAMAGAMSLDEFRRRKVLRGADGKWYSLENIMRFSEMTVPESKRSQLGENLIKDRIAFALCPECLSWFGAETLEEWLEKLDSIHILQHMSVLNQNPISRRLPQPRSFREFSALYDGQYMAVRKEDQTKQERLALSVFNQDFHLTILQACLRAFNVRQAMRQVRLGESDIADGWTDGTKHIFIERGVLTRNMNQGVVGAEYLIKLLVHEYCHTDSSNKEHAHGEEFLKRFHDCLFELNTSGLAVKLTKLYFNKCEKAGLPFKTAVAKSIDAAKVVNVPAEESDVQ
ncbi:MAG: hypothetical protein C9356_14820 [Oleiphilus sp.]|nr:MAG: hypothetical protein C9356_14820 [Oleiphilus sp.]